MLRSPPWSPNEANLLKCGISTVAYSVNTLHDSKYVAVIFYNADRYMNEMRLVISCAYTMEGPLHTILLATPVIWITDAML